MKQGLVSPDFLCLLSVSLSESQLTILLSISETAIADLFRKSNIFIKLSMILPTPYAVLRLRYSWILFDCSGAFLPMFRHCYRKIRLVL